MTELTPQKPGVLTTNAVRFRTHCARLAKPKRQTQRAPDGSSALKLWQLKEALAFLLLHEAAELVVEARDAAAAIEQRLVAAGPGRVRLGIDFERQGRAVLTVGRTGLEGGAVGHLDRD